ncbi:MAG: cytochrome c, partial [Actinomyces sp.]
AEPDTGPIDPDAEPDTGPIDPDAAERGAGVYAASCAVCHGADASGASGPSLVGVVARDGAAAVEAVIRAGRGAMPAWQNRLGDDEIADLLAYLATGP